MTSLLSVLLVASSASGSRLLFAYPPNAVATPRVQRPLYGKSAAIRDVQARSSDDQSSLSTSSSDEEQAASKQTRSHKSRLAVSKDDSEDEAEANPDDIYGSRFIRGESSSSSSEEEGDSNDDWDEDYLQDEYDTREKKERENYKIHLGLDTSVLGSLLCPTKELCNKRFEMVINHLAFIAHPASSSRSKAQANRKDKDLDSPFLSDDEGNDNMSTSRRFTHLDEARGRSAPSSGFSSRRHSRSVPAGAAARAAVRGDNKIGASRESSRTRRSSNSTQPRPSVSSGVSGPARSHPQGNPALSPMHHATSKDSPHMSNTYPLPALPHSSSSNPELDVWAIVLVIDSPPDQHLSYHLDVYYRDVVVPLMAALKYEERRDGYVTNEVAKISSLREKAEDTGMSLTPHVNDLCQQSTLCEQLAALYHGIKKHNSATLTLNDDIELSVLLHAELFVNSRYSGSASSGSNGYDLGGNVAGSYHSTTYDRHTLSLRNRHHPTPYYNQRLELSKLTKRLTGGLLDGSPGGHVHIQPWQSLLPLQDPENLLKEVDYDGLLMRFLEIMSPTLTFTEYETLLGTDSDDIIDIAEHLIYWRKARLIDALSLKSIYVPIRPARPGSLRLLADWSKEFAAHFPELPPLPVLLATLSTPQPFETIVPPGHKLRSIYLDALTWLLQQDLVTQLRVYMNLVATPEVKRSAYEREEARQKRRNSGSDHSANEEDVASEKGGEERKDLKNNEVSNQSDISIASKGSTGRGSSNDAGSSNILYSSTRSPLPRSFPQNYPYISAANASTAHRPKTSNLHSGKTKSDHNLRGSKKGGPTSEARRAFLAALNAPSIISNPSEPSSEEELWIAEIISQVQESKGNSASTAIFNQMLPFLDGTHHLDEILYRASLSRKAVRGVLADFDGYLVSFVT